MVFAQGVCERHYQLARARERGITRKPKPGETRKWYRNKAGYVVRKQFDEVNVRYFMQLQHRLIMEEYLG